MGKLHFLAVTLSLLWASFVTAQAPTADSKNYLTKPVTIIVGFAPGSNGTEP